MKKLIMLTILLVATACAYAQTPSSLYQQFNDSTTSVAERKEMFRELTNTEKADVWLEHLKTGFSRYDLTFQEKAVLQKVIGAISPTLYEHKTDLIIERLESEVKSTF